MVRAATTKVVDYTTFDPNNAWEWKRLKLLLDDMERQQDSDMFKTLHTRYAMLHASGRSSEARTEYSNLSEKHRTTYMQKLQPWADFAPTSGDSTIADMLAQYEAGVASGWLNDGTKPRKPVK